ncbi:hypothetical protein [Dysosmobacter sp.]|uniref:hypothetical protein n=1 Tax=Dysosmobacter sp. TaxID=2591382 RepID=UPI002A89ACBB|nr:hypothetical protein [Dysosmobacter sp.]MDY3281211.1 hypothetical protein [Dysosmobacter sp.]
MIAVWNRCQVLLAELLARADTAARPVLENDGLLIAIALVSLILGPLLTFAHVRLGRQAPEPPERFFGYYGILSRLFYYPVVFAVSLLCAVSGQGGNTGIFQGMVSAHTRATLSNFGEWNDTCRYLFTFLLLYAVLRTLFCLLKLRFFRLLRFWLHTVNCVTLGVLAAQLYLALTDASRGNFLMTLVQLAVGFCLYSVYVMVFMGITAPLVLIAVPLLAPLGLLFRGVPLFLPLRCDNDLEELGGFLLFGAWAEAFSA